VALKWLKSLLLSVLGVRHLQKIKLELRMTKGTRWNALKPIDRVFDGNIFPQLNEVEIFVISRSASKWGETEAAVAGAFPVLAGRKLLVIKSVFEDCL
jgi:hypothetical protein